MFGKLFKDEFNAYVMPVGISFLAAIGITFFMKVLCILPYPDEVEGTMQFLSSTAFGYGIKIMSFVTAIFVILHFYKTTVSDRAYLTWTLPASSSYIVGIKLLVACIWRVFTLIVVIVLEVVFYSGDYWEDALFSFKSLITQNVMKEGMNLFGEFIKESGIHFVTLLCLSMLLAIGIFLFSTLLVYFCISVGQLVGKLRILASIGCYFAFVFIEYIIGIVLVVFAICVGIKFIDQIPTEILGIKSYLLIGEFGVGLAATVFLVVDAVLFLGTCSIFKKHLNLE